MFKAKILMIGPCQAGKTFLANFLADATEGASDEYHATQGVRIVEFESTNIATGGGRTANCEVEMWDVSGDTKFENCWPAVARDTTGIILVCNPNQPNTDKQIDAWYNYFGMQQNLKESQMLLFAHHKTSGGSREDPQLSSALNNVPVVHTCLEEDAEDVRNEFNKFLSSLMVSMSEKREQEELSIMNSRG